MPDAQSAVSGAVRLPRRAHAALELCHACVHVEQVRARPRLAHSGHTWVVSILGHATRFVVGRPACGRYSRCARAGWHSEYAHYSCTFVRAQQRRRGTAAAVAWPEAAPSPVWSYFGVGCRPPPLLLLTPDARVVCTNVNYVQNSGERGRWGGGASPRAGRRCFVVLVNPSTAEGNAIFGRFGGEYVPWDVYPGRKGGAWIYICGAGVRPIQYL